MKKFLTLFSVILTFLLIGCNTTEQNQQIETGNFKFKFLKWGIDWETVQKYDDFQNVKYKIEENGHRQTVRIEGMEYLGIEIDTVALVFDVADETETKGLYNIFLQFDEENEELLLANLESIYGDRQDYYLDKNGVENPISPAGWVSNVTIEDVLTEKEQEYYISLFPALVHQSRIDAALRSPLVSIRFDEERNFVEFNANAESIVEFVKAKLEK